MESFNNLKQTFGPRVHAMTSALCFAGTTAATALLAAVCGAVASIHAKVRSPFANQEAQILPCPTSEAALREVLEAADIDTSMFGVDKAKTLTALFGELREGSSCLELDAVTGKICRRVEPVNVQLRHNGYVLVERSQVLPSGKKRERNILLSEKIDPTDADPLAAALRGIEEELKVQVPLPFPEGLRHCSEEDRTYTKHEESASYPGLQATYVTHLICLELLVDSPAAHLFAGCGLPAGTPFETTEIKTEGTLRLQWQWPAIEEAQEARVKGLPPA